jgi:hypothetical protein
VAGTEPRDTCEGQSGVKGIFSRIFGGGDKPATPQDANGANPAGGNEANNGQEPKKKKGFFGKIAGVFKGDNKNPPPANPPQPAPQ